jgi:hypothetical protein
MCGHAKHIQRFVFFVTDMNRNDTGDVRSDGTSEQQRKQNIPLMRMIDFIAQNLFCTGAGPRIAV